MEAYKHLVQGQCIKPGSFYEEATTAHSEQILNYLYLGLAHLLQGDEETAQATWLLTMIEAGDEAADYSHQLFQVLQTEAEHQEERENYKLAWVIRQHAKEFLPINIDNLLKIIELSINHLKNFEPENLESLGLVNLLESNQISGINTDLLLDVLKQVLETLCFEPVILKFVKACKFYMPTHVYVDCIIPTALKYGFVKNQPQVAVQLAEICLEAAPDNLLVLQHLASLYQDSGEYIKGIEVSKHYRYLSLNLADAIYAHYLLIRGYLNTGGHWEDASRTFQDYLLLLSQLANSQEPDLPNLEIGINYILSNKAFFLPYFQDQPQVNQKIQNQISGIAAKRVKTNASQQSKAHSRSLINHSSTQLKLGFVSHCFRKHSVGWLCRWLFQHYCKDSFQVHLYFHAHEPTDEFSYNWFIKNAWQSHSSLYHLELAEQIYKDQVNILIDLDSITLDTTCELMASKPAPVQVTWLGWDASGIPAIDYFIADPYVLPEDAQEYYQETIWRLPQTYIAVDGFEVGTPTLRRDQLGIPTDAVIYLSAQRGYKRHPDTARLQMKILKEVPNSYFLVKGLGDQEAVQQFFTQLAEEEGVDPERLRFPPLDPNEYIHRANLGIADVVLDTYPYNGATTTLETLWMGIPLVTRVGQQFAARNSYAFMMNVGVTEGIAWTDEEYVEWGVRLGKDEALRQQVAWKLKASRQTSPLWNAKQFTREMETAFQQMWQRYVEAGQSKN